MFTCEVKQHIEVHENFQGFNLTEFSFSDNEGLSCEELVELFIRSTHYKFDCLPDVVKADTHNKPYLRQAFDTNEICISDFKKFDKLGISNYLLDFLNAPDWTDDRKEFEILHGKYLEIHNQLADADFFVISKEWFEQGDKRVLEPENWCYNYYFLILYLNKSTSSLILTEWAYD